MAKLKTIEIMSYDTQLNNKETSKKDILHNLCLLLEQQRYKVKDNVYSCTGYLYLYKTDYKRKDNFFIVCFGYGCNYGHRYYTEYKSLCKIFKNLEDAKEELESIKSQLYKREG